MKTVKLIVNGGERTFEDVETVADLLRILEIDPAAGGVAVAVNMQVIPRASLAETPLEDGARVEVVKAVQGG